MSVNLCIDRGNTSVKAGVFVNEKLTHTFNFSHEDALAHLTGILQTHKPDKSILSSVADHNTDLEHFFAEQGRQLLKLDGFTRLPINNAYLSNDTIGADRLAMVTAAHLEYPDKNNLVVCLGTCITYNFITKNKTFRGGAIAPGMEMRFKAMHHYTERLPETDADGDLLLLGYDTASCMRSGVVYGMACEVDGMISEFEKSFGDFNAILTGGDVPFFANKLKSKIFADPEIQLKGLNLILNYNVPIPR